MAMAGWCCILLPISITKVCAIALVDTGASASFMSLHFAHAQGFLNIHLTPSAATLAHGTATLIHGRTPALHCSVSSFHFKPGFHALPALDGMDIVLGMHWLHQHDIKPPSRSHGHKHPSNAVTSALDGMDWLHQHDVKVEAHRPCITILANNLPLIVRTTTHAQAGPVATTTLAMLSLPLDDPIHEMRSVYDQLFIGCCKELLVL
jgi:hypothetical protein